MALPAIVLLENEEPFHGSAAGTEAGMVHGVIAVSALSTGFPDLLTDPFYSGKILCFTYPHVGTAGMVPDDVQSDAIAARAVIGREIGTFAANRLGTESMESWLTGNSIPAVSGVDTRSLTEIVTRRGNVRAVVGTGKYADAALLAKEFTANPAAWEVKNAGVTEPRDWSEKQNTAPKFTVIVYDFGVKKGFLRRLAAMGCAVKLVPSNFPAEKALTENPSGIVFSAGNGTPESRAEALPAAKALLGKTPLWGVGVGAGILAQAAGAKITTNGRAHRGTHPVGRTGSPSGEMTAQCHEFWIENDSLAGANLEQTHFNLNDGSTEGFRCAARTVMGTLFHPEAEPGQQDSLYLFDRFHTMMTRK